MSKKLQKKLIPTLVDLLKQKQAVCISLRQASEWGMRGLQISLSRLKSRLTSNKQNRHHLILSIVLLHKFITEHVGLNQIQSVFSNPNCPHINLEGFDRIARYFDGF